MQKLEYILFDGCELVLKPDNINKLAFSEGINGDFVELIWNPGEFPLIKYHYKSVYNSEETKLQKDNINTLAEHLKNFIPLFLEVQKAEEKMETK